jgi:hypothetical protein
MSYFVISAPLRRGSMKAVREILRDGPPFDIERTSLERHQVFLGRDELVFLFEGPHAEQEVRRLSDDLKILGQASRLARYLKGAPRVSQEVFSWVRAPSLQGVSFGAQPGPGDSDGG